MSTSAEQVERLLREIPYIEDHPGITLQEVASEFSISVKQVVKDMEVAIFCGRPGGYPGDLIDVDLEVMEGESCIYLHNPALEHPVSMSSAESASLRLALMALRSLVSIETVEHIDSVLDKIASRSTNRVELSVIEGDEAVRRIINDALTRAERLRLTYVGQARGIATHPVIDPVAMFVSEGVAYLSAYCVRRDSDQTPPAYPSGWRTYRLDRIEEACPTGELIEAHESPPDADSWARSLAESATVRLTLTEDAAWIGEYYTSMVEKKGEGLVVAELPVVSSAWLTKLLLSLGDKVVSVEPDSYALDARTLARQTLDAYASLGLLQP